MLIYLAKVTMMKKLILAACLTSGLSLTPHHAQAMQPALLPDVKSSLFMTTVKRHKIIAGTSASLIALGIGCIVMAIHTTPSLSELFNSGPEVLWEPEERLKKIERARHFLVFGVACLLAAGCTFGGTWWKEYKKAAPVLRGLPIAAHHPAAPAHVVEPLAALLPTRLSGAQHAAQKATSVAQQQPAPQKPAEPLAQQSVEQRQNQGDVVKPAEIKPAETLAQQQPEAAPIAPAQLVPEAKHDEVALHKELDLVFEQQELFAQEEAARLLATTAQGKASQPAEAAPAPAPVPTSKESKIQLQKIANLAQLVNQVNSQNLVKTLQEISTSEVPTEKQKDLMIQLCTKMGGETSTLQQVDDLNMLAELIPQIIELAQSITSGAAAEAQAAAQAKN